MFILESPRMGACRTLCYVTLSTLGVVDVTMDRALALRFPSKSMARRKARNASLMSHFDFKPVEVEA